MKKFLLVHLAILSVLLAINPAGAYINNGGFEQGTTTYWTCASGACSDSQVVTSFTSEFGNPNTTNPKIWTPEEGNYFLVIRPTDFGVSRFTQDVYLNVGDVISGWAAGERYGIAGPGLSIIYNGTYKYSWDGLSNPFYDWTYWEWTALESGTYQIELYAVAPGPFVSNAIGLFDGIKVVAPVPIPAAVWLLGTCLIGLLGLRRKFQK